MNRFYLGESDTTPPQRWYPRTEWPQRLAWGAIGVLLLVLLGTSLASAQTAPTLTFTPETVTGVESVTPRFTWSTQPEASSCTAGGDHPEWTGPKPAQGTVELSPVTQSGVFTFECEWIGGRVVLTWTPPTKNTDGSAFTNPKGILIHHGPSEDMRHEVIAVNEPSPPLGRYVLDGLPAGPRYFSLQVANSNDVLSDDSNVAMKVVPASATVNRSVTITVNPKSERVTDLAAE